MVSLAGAAASIIFYDKNMLVAIKDIVATNTLITTNNFLAIFFLLRQLYFCRDKRRVLSRQTHVCRDKSMLAATKMIRAAAPANDSLARSSGEIDVNQGTLNTLSSNTNERYTRRWVKSRR